MSAFFTKAAKLQLFHPLTKDLASTGAGNKSLPPNTMPVFPYNVQINFFKSN
jgi:hypothetical protein